MFVIIARKILLMIALVRIIMSNKYSVILENLKTGTKKKYGSYNERQDARIIRWCLYRKYQYRKHIIVSIIGGNDESAN